MKKLITLSFLSILLVAVVSCKKNYTCACVTTVTYTGTTLGSQDIFNSATKTYSEKMTENQAKSACEHEAESINSTIDDNIKQSSANGRAVAITNCALR